LCTTHEKIYWHSKSAFWITAIKHLWPLCMWSILSLQVFYSVKTNYIPRYRVAKLSLFFVEQGVALTGRNRTGPPCIVGSPTAHAPGPSAADRPRARRPARPPAGSATDDDRCQPAKQYWPIRQASNNAAKWTYVNHSWYRQSLGNLVKEVVDWMWCRPHQKISLREFVQCKSNSVRWTLHRQVSAVADEPARCSASRPWCGKQWWTLSDTGDGRRWN